MQLMMKRVGVLLFLTAVVAYAQPAPPAPVQGVYIGFVGNQAVVAQLTSEGETRGRFYYRRDGLDIQLEGSIQNGKYVFGERQPSGHPDLGLAARRPESVIAGG
jgi:hypothetical protein